MLKLYQGNYRITLYVLQIYELCLLYYWKYNGASCNAAKKLRPAGVERDKLILYNALQRFESA